MAAYQTTLFDTQPYTPKERTLYERIIPAPEHIRGQQWRVCYPDNRIGRLLGTIYTQTTEETPHGYLVALYFEDGCVYTFDPMQLFPVLENGTKPQIVSAGRESEMKHNQNDEPKREK